MSTALAVEMKPVESSRIKEIGHDGDSFTLYIRFVPTKKKPIGALYWYQPVSEEFFDDFLNAKSKGTFFAERILNNRELSYGGEVLSQNEVREMETVAPLDSTEGQTLVLPAAEPLPPIPEDGDGLKLQALEVSSQVRALSIRTSDEYLGAGNELLRLRAMKKAALERVERIKRPAYETYRAALELEKDVMFPYDQAEAYLNSAMGAYRETERRERVRVEAELTRERQQAAQEEAARRSKELAEEDAKIALAQGQSQEVVEQIRQQPLPLAPAPVSGVVLPREVPKIKGIIERAPVWKWRVKPGEELLVPREYLCVNETAVNSVVRGLKGLTKIAGIEVYEEEAKVGVRA